MFYVWYITKVYINNKLKYHFDIQALRANLNTTWKQIDLIKPNPLIGLCTRFMFWVCTCITPVSRKCVYLNLGTYYKTTNNKYNMYLHCMDAYTCMRRFKTNKALRYWMKYWGGILVHTVFEKFEIYYSGTDKRTCLNYIYHELNNMHISICS